jgi:formate/nitrite transporter FocA (FNT family)
MNNNNQIPTAWERFNIAFSKSVFAGICIGIAGWGFLVDKTLGMFLFVFGLATVVSYEAKLYTGMSGFCRNMRDVGELVGVVLPGNIIGCLIVALISYYTNTPIHHSAQTVLAARLASGPLTCGALGIGCGILMTSSVAFAKKSKDFGHWVPLLFAVPLFIHCGFPHCIADAFYYLTAGDYVIHHPQVLLCYLATVIGNFVGCNVPRIASI